MRKQLALESLLTSVTLDFLVSELPVTTAGKNLSNQSQLIEGRKLNDQNEVSFLSSENTNEADGEGSRMIMAIDRLST